MKKQIVLIALVSLMVGASAFSAAGQKSRPKPIAVSQQLIAAVLNDGKVIEPIAILSIGKLSEPVNGSDNREKVAVFDKRYYPSGRVYSLIFGGIKAGTVTVTGFNSNAECSANMADVTSVTTKTPLKGNVMALATNAKVAKNTAGLRRLPTAAERAEIELLVAEEMAKNGAAGVTVKSLKYQNLTAVNLDADSDAEFVGSYFAPVGEKSRALLAFIAERGDDGKFALGLKNYSLVKEADTMSSDIKDVDSGVYHERYLDQFDIDGDGVSEVFMYVMGFEGATFNVYRRSGAVWTKLYEFANYHCGY